MSEILQTAIVDHKLNCTVSEQIIISGRSES